jgi:DNA methylase
MDITRTRLPLDKEAYFPDPAEPVDRWFQADNSGNAQTVRKLIRFFAPRAESVIDPFAGAGSTAAAARSLGMPFFGIEHHPVLAAACLAKLHTSRPHVGLLGETLSTDDTAALEQTLIDIKNRTEGALTRDLSALAIICYLSARSGRPLTAEALAADLRSIPAPPPAGSVVYGDCTTPGAWHLARIPSRPSVVYTSPPFGASSPKLKAPAPVELSAAELLRSAGLESGSLSDRFTSYTELTLGMLRQALPRLMHSSVIIECEPDHGKDPGESLLERIIDEFGAIVRRVRLFDCGSFSKRGRFSLLVFDV